MVQLSLPCPPMVWCLVTVQLWRDLVIYSLALHCWDQGEFNGQQSAAMRGKVFKRKNRWTIAEWRRNERAMELRSWGGKSIFLTRPPTYRTSGEEWVELGKYAKWSLWILGACFVIFNFCLDSKLKKYNQIHENHICKEGTIFSHMECFSSIFHIWSHSNGKQN